MGPSTMERISESIVDVEAYPCAQAPDKELALDSVLGREYELG